MQPDLAFFFLVLFSWEMFSSKSGKIFEDDDNSILAIHCFICYVFLFQFHHFCQHLFMQLPAVVFLMTSLSLLSILITIFLFYHLYLLLTNQTTNERYKRSRVIGDVKMSSSQRSTKRRSRHRGGGASWNYVDVSYNKGLVRNIWEVLYPPI